MRHIHKVCVTVRRVDCTEKIGFSILITRPVLGAKGGFLCFAVHVLGFNTFPGFLKLLPWKFPGILNILVEATTGADRSL